MPHRIRLRGPWSYQPLCRLIPLESGCFRETRENLPPAGTLHLPADWGGVLGAAFQGTVRFTRPFAKPTGLDSASRVWLVIDDVDWQASTVLNDRLCGEVVSSAE